MSTIDDWASVSDLKRLFFGPDSSEIEFLREAVAAGITAADLLNGVGGGGSGGIEVVQHTGLAGAAETVSFKHNQWHTVTVDQNTVITLDWDGEADQGGVAVIEITQDGDGGNIPTFANVANYIGHGSPPVFDTGPNQTTLIEVYTLDGVLFYAFSNVQSQDVWRRPGVLVENFSRFGRTFGNGSVLAAGRETCVGIDIPANRLITQIGFTASGTGLTLGGTTTTQIFTLRDEDYNLIGVTNDHGATAWASGDEKFLTLTSPHETTYGGIHYAGILVAFTGTAGVVPSLLAVLSSTNQNLNDPRPVFPANTGLTALTIPAIAVPSGSLGPCPWVQLK